MASEVEKLLNDILNNEEEDITPTSRIEAYLKACCKKCGCQDVPEPVSRVDVLLYELAEQAENAIPTNIREGVKIFGVTGNLAPDKPDQTKTVTPTESEQTVYGDTGYELASVTVEAIQTETKTAIENGEVTPTQGKYLKKVTVNVPAPVMQEKTVEPTTSQIIVTPESGYDGISKVTVEAIQTETKTATANGIITSTSGKYLTAVTVAIPEYNGEVE